MQRPVSSLPRGIVVALVAALLVQLALGMLRPRPIATAQALAAPPPLALLRVAAAGEPIAASYLLTLDLQAYDNQPGISIPFRDLDYVRVIAWLSTIVDLDPRNQYPLLLASQVYAQVPDAKRQRLMLDFVQREFVADPDGRWRWLAHAAIMAKHRLHDPRLALTYAENIAQLARHAPSWARQMRIFILEDMGEVEAAKILLGGLLASGEIRDQRERYFLSERLQHMADSAEKPSASSIK